MLRSLRDDNERLRARLERLERALQLPVTPREPDEQLLDAELATTDLPPPQHGG